MRLPMNLLSPSLLMSLYVIGKRSRSYQMKYIRTVLLHFHKTVTVIKGIILREKIFYLAFGQFCWKGNDRHTFYMISRSKSDVSFFVWRSVVKWLANIPKISNKISAKMSRIDKSKIIRMILLNHFTVLPLF